MSNLSNNHRPILFNSPVDIAIYKHSIKYFVEQSEENFFKIDSLLSNNSDKHGHGPYLIIQAANTVLDEEGKHISRVIQDNGGAIQCHQGCIECCKQAIVCDPFEDTLIALFLVANRGPRQLFNRAYARWRERTKNLHGSFLSWAEQYYKNGIDTGVHNLLDYYEPCPFLCDGLCQIYPVRPYVCRGYLAVSETCHTPVNPDERAGMHGMDFGSFTNHKKARNVMYNLLHRKFQIDPTQMTAQFMPDRVYDLLHDRYLDAESRIALLARKVLRAQKSTLDESTESLVLPIKFIPTPCDCPTASMGRGANARRSLPCRPIPNKLSAPARCSSPDKKAV
jgi:Fe-S-cluster containining protein